jgi:hypothetical protein
MEAAGIPVDKNWRASGLGEEDEEADSSSLPRRLEVLGDSPLYNYSLSRARGERPLRLNLEQRVTESVEWIELAGPERPGLSSAQKKERSERQSKLMDRCRALIGQLFSELSRGKLPTWATTELESEIRSLNAETERMKALPEMKELLAMREQLERTSASMTALRGLSAAQGIDADAAITHGLEKIIASNKPPAVIRSKRSKEKTSQSSKPIKVREFTHR